MNKASGADGIPVELFQILKDDAVKVQRSICQQIRKIQQWPQDWKRSAFILIPKKGNAKECSNYHTITLISHASKVMLKILQARFQKYLTRTSRCSSWFQKRQRNQRLPLQRVFRDFPVAQTVMNLPARQETRVLSLGWKVPLEKGMAIHSSILALRIPWTEKPSGLQPRGSQKVRLD